VRIRAEPLRKMKPDAGSTTERRKSMGNKHKRVLSFAMSAVMMLTNMIAPMKVIGCFRYFETTSCESPPFLP